MGKLRPIGSEKLEGMDKISRIMEIARYKENIPTPINEDKSVEYRITLADGKNYQIHKEKSGYVIKRTVNESSEVDYLEPMKNRKYYPSYSQAFKRLNLIAKEVNVNEEFDKNISLFNESAGIADEAKKYILKVSANEQDVPAEAPVAPSPAPATAPSPVPTEEPMEPEMDIETDVETDVEPEDEEVVTFKTIEKLTGKLGQKIREFLSNEENQMSSKDIKYVVNSILSALELNKLDSEDKEEIVAKFEGGEMGSEETEIEPEMEVTPEVEPETGVEMEEENYGSFGNMKRKDFRGDNYYDENDRLAKDSDIYNIGNDSDFDTEEFDSFQKLYDKYGDKQRWFNKRDGETMFNKYKEVTGRPFKVKTRKTEMEEELTSKDAKTMMKDIFGEESDIESEPKKRKIKHHSMTDEESAKVEEMIEGMFTESKVDNILKKYFRIDEKEKRLLEEKREKQVISDKETSKVNNRIKNLSESISQEISSKKLYKKYPNAKFLGKSTNQNLVFEVGNKKLRVTTNGNVK